MVSASEAENAQLRELREAGEQYNEVVGKSLSELAGKTSSTAVTLISHRNNLSMTSVPAQAQVKNAAHALENLAGEFADVKDRIERYDKEHAKKVRKQAEDAYGQLRREDKHVNNDEMSVSQIHDLFEQSERDERQELRAAKYIHRVLGQAKEYFENKSSTLQKDAKNVRKTLTEGEPGLALTHTGQDLTQLASDVEKTATKLHGMVTGMITRMITIIEDAQKRTAQAEEIVEQDRKAPKIKK